MVTEKMIEAAARAAEEYVAATGIPHSGGYLEAAFEAGAKWAQEREAALSTDAKPVSEGWLYDQEWGNAFKSYWKTILIDREPGSMRGIRNIRKVYAAPPALSVAVKALQAIANYRRHSRLDSYENAEAMEQIARSALAAQVQDVAGWKDISTAPRDETPLLLCCVDWPHSTHLGKPVPIKVGGFGPNGWHVFGASWKPTHWMPLPAAPAAKQGEAK